MKLQSILLVICLTLFFAGCIFNSDSDYFKGEYLDSYFPLNPKLSSKFLVTTYVDTVAIQDQIVRSFKGTREVGDKIYYRLQVNENDKYAYYRIENDILYRFYDSGEKMFVPRMHEEPLLDFSRQPGETWTAVTSIIPDVEGEIAYTLTVTFQGVEAINTIAGMFNDCARFDNHETVVYSSVKDENGDPVTLEMNYQTWYARGVGLIKLRAEGDIFGTYEIDIYDYSR
ncbi:hypothetical protein ACFL47_04300 [Candidatus Latescibacterota bacterium]